MMSLGALGFLSPWLLAALVALPAIWWLLRVTPPGPKHVFFPATRLLLGIEKKEEDQAHSPWWLTLLRLLTAAAIILALARPVLNPDTRAVVTADVMVAFVDNGWASAANWAQRRTTLLQLLERAEQANRPVLILSTAGPQDQRSFASMQAAKAREQIAAHKPLPYAPDRLKALARLNKADLKGKVLEIVWLSDGLDYGKGTEFTQKLARRAGARARLTIFQNGKAHPGPFALFARISPKGHLEAIVNSPGGIAHKGRVIARDNRGRAILEQVFNLEKTAKSTSVPFKLPLELRNQVARLDINEARSAGSVYLIDQSSYWQRVGLIGGGSSEEAQPLLSPLYYIRKALAPFTEITLSEKSNIADATQTMVERKTTSLVLAGVGRLDFETSERLDDWTRRGGVLIRFAGPRLEQGGDELLPLPLRQGGRSLGGALSWSEPQKLADFERASPFFGLDIPKDVEIRRQVLADPLQISDSTLIWARLQDGTPLVTARKSGRGLLVLFHVTANSNWSNLPHSGLFVQMLRRLTDLSTGLAPKSATNADDTGAVSQPAQGKGETTRESAEQPMLPPLRVLDGFGDFTAIGAEVEPLKLADLKTTQPHAANPPGLYGVKGKSRAFNIGQKELQLMPLEPAPRLVMADTYDRKSSVPLTPWLLGLALLLFLIDSLIIMWLRGLPSIGRTPATAGALAVVLAGSLLVDPALAASPKAAPGDAKPFDLQMSLDTHLAFVRTGNSETDRVSSLGLKALSRHLSRRTAFEPADPVGVDIARDDLSFFPLLYWPVTRDVKKLDAPTLAKVNAFMKKGGVILFDTQNQERAFLDDLQAGLERPLHRLIGGMDIPPLAPVPPDHVLTRSFYLLNDFPGRWSGGALWVEDLGESRQSALGKTTARSADGVSSIIVTSNNLAAAWASDDQGHTLFPVTPGGERQREMAYRAGINIVMYALTGNYKADQVHLPALMRRLGQ